MPVDSLVASPATYSMGTGGGGLLRYAGDCSPSSGAAFKNPRS
jgi:hypothetical protein